MPRGGAGGRLRASASADFDLPYLQSLGVFTATSRPTRLVYHHQGHMIALHHPRNPANPSGRCVSLPFASPATPACSTAYGPEDLQPSHHRCVSRPLRPSRDPAPRFATLPVLPSVLMPTKVTVLNNGPIRIEGEFEILDP